MAAEIEQIETNPTNKINNDDLQDLSRFAGFLAAGDSK